MSSLAIFIYMYLRMLFPRLIELLLHGRIVASQFLDGQILCLVVGQTEVVLRSYQGILDFLQVGNGLVNLVNGGLELLTGQTIVTEVWQMCKRN